jgi:hypothetical protein
MLASQLAATGWGPLRVPNAENTILGAAIPIALILVWQAIYLLVWRSWDQRAAQVVLEEVKATHWESVPEEVKVGDWAYRFFSQAIYISFGFVPLTFLSLMWWRPLIFTAAGLETRFYHLLGWIFVSLFGGMMGVALIRQVISIVRLAFSASKRIPWKEIGGAVYFLAFGLLFFVMLAPGVASKNLQSTVAVGFGMVLLGAKLVSIHLKRVNQIRSRMWKGVSLVGPFLAAIALMLFDPRPNEPVMDHIVTAVGLYMFAVLLVAAIVALATRWRGPKDRGGRAAAAGA